MAEFVSGKSGKEEEFDWATGTDWRWILCRRPFNTEGIADDTLAPAYFGALQLSEKVEWVLKADKL